MVPHAIAGLLAVAAFVLPDAALAQCRTEGTGARCIRVLAAEPESARSGSSAASALVAAAIRAFRETGLVPTGVDRARGY